MYIHYIYEKALNSSMQLFAKKIGFNMYKEEVTKLDVIWTKSWSDENKENIYLDESVMRGSMQRENASGNVSVNDRSVLGG